MANTPYMGIMKVMQGLYRVLIKGLLGCVQGIVTVAHVQSLNPTCRLIPCSFFAVPFFSFKILKVGFPKRGVWYEPTGSMPAKGYLIK